VKKAYLIIPREIIDQLDEALALCETAGYRVERVIKTRYRNRVGKGLIEEISNTIEDDVDTIIFYGTPSPSTVFQLMKKTGKRVIDRVQLILEIFAEHAGSREAKLQIEAAKVKHEIPLVREWIRRSKLGEMPGFLGPGTYAIDAYYRHLTSKLARIRRELERLRRLRDLRRRSREKLGYIHVSIVGYASAGKTSIFNLLTGEKKPVGREYFTTLHPKHKHVARRDAGIILVDTVGFIRDIPPEIIEAFYSTLEEITYSDIIVFVVDVSDPSNVMKEKILSGYEIMARIGAIGKPVIIAANKIDLVDGTRIPQIMSMLEELTAGRAEAIIPVSAKTGYGIEKLLNEILKLAGKVRLE
jgi:GTP-binding protein HflX